MAGANDIGMPATFVVGTFLSTYYFDWIIMETKSNISANPIGVMQGRLLPKYQGRYQAHPVGYWQDEFAIVRELNLDCIEFILDYNDAELNPLLTRSGVDKILQMEETTGVSVRTVCADYFMEAPLHSSDQNIVEKSVAILKILLANGKTLGLTDIVIPCVDQSTLVDSAARDRFIKNTRPLLDIAGSAGINLSLETDLAPEPFAELLARFDSPHVTVNYDTGNSASLGFDPIEELNCYGDRISDIHIKDRVLGGGSVTLGTGNARFDRFFEALTKLDYRGPFILQAYRDDEGIAVFKQQLTWITENYLKV